MEMSQELADDAVAIRVRAAFKEQEGWCAKLGSPFTALLCSTLAERLDASTLIGRRVLSWPGDPTAQGDALPLRVCGALHGLARSNQEPALTAVYPGTARQVADDDLWLAVGGALERNPAHFETYLATAPQTNEVGRSAVLMCGFLEIARRVGLPVQLFEIGASAGLNLLADRYRYRFGATEWGDPHAALLLEPQWQGSAPPVEADFRVVERSGCDVAPLDISIPEQRARLVSYVWPDQTDRLSRLEAAIATALREPPRLERMEAARWVEDRIVETAGQPGRVRVLFHSVVWGYFPLETQQRLAAHMERCGARAETRSPLAWLRFELIDTPPGAALTLKMWPTGEEVVLAHAQPHGRSIVHLGRP
ncbi:MAG: DUF2332 domain-containing protein [Steroidobacteraceae bacterium]